MVEVKKFLDTYALMEIYLGNEKFAEYLNADFVINDLILSEFYGVILREYGEAEANFWYKKLERYSLSVFREILIEAIKFKNEHRKREISFFDAVGYVFAVKNGLRFVTGDKEFSDLSNVEFKKK